MLCMTKNIFNYFSNILKIFYKSNYRYIQYFSINNNLFLGFINRAILLLFDRKFFIKENIRLIR